MAKKEERCRTGIMTMCCCIVVCLSSVLFGLTEMNLSYLTAKRHSQYTKNSALKCCTMLLSKDVETDDTRYVRDTQNCFNVMAAIFTPR